LAGVRSSGSTFEKNKIMNPTHIHLIITHMPIFGSFFGILVLVHGLWTKSNAVKVAAYNVFIISALGASLAFFTGESAEETVEHLQGISEQVIEAHEESASVALGAFIALGAAAIVALALTLKKSNSAALVSRIMLFLAVFSFALVARTGFLGGQIRYTEISASADAPQAPSLEQDEDD
jgi:uncharacterized membrane protein